MNIFAISGGQLSEGQTLAFDRFNVELTGKSRPKALFVPTASYDSPGYCQSFRDIYEKRLGCEVSFLLLESKAREPALVQDLIGAADIVYVGGGNTLRMMNTWKRHGVDRMLQALGGSDKVLTGLSAGAICWYEFGHSDSRKTATSDHIRVTGLGMLSGIYCPHFDTEQRESDFVRLIKKRPIVGYACDDLTAIWHTDRNRNIVRSLEPTARVAVYSRDRGQVSKRVYADGEETEQHPFVPPAACAVPALHSE